MKAYKSLTFFIILLAFVFSCKTAKKDGQGIQGQVFWLEGNQMPQMAKEGEMIERPAKKGVKRTLKIHELTHINQARLGDALFGDIETPLVIEIETDESGNFSVELPAGKYSIFTVEEAGHFANILDLDSYINPFEVKEGEWTQADILINYQAAY
jgi:hypothetical protein